MPPFYCSQLSRNASEEIFGTASRAGVWFVLEVPRPWAAEAFGGCRLPERVKEWLAHYQQNTPRSRLLFIKQSYRPVSPLTFYLAIAHETHPELYEFQLNAYEDLLALDILGILAGDPKYDEFVNAGPLLAVCTHGTHDKCCSKFGLPIYTAMAKVGGPSVWQCSHVGGDRFAANVVCFPHGTYYGQVEADDVTPIVEETRRGRIVLGKYRGRSCYGFLVQAAEYFLRVQTGIMELSAFRLLETHRAAENSWRVLFFCVVDEKTHLLQLSRETAESRNYLTCKAEQASNVVQYRLDDHEVLKR